MDARRNADDYSDASSNGMAYGWARENARYYLRNAIDEEVDNLDDITPQTWKIATHNVVKRLKGSTQMVDLIDDVKKRLKIYSGNICLHVDSRAQPIPLNSLKALTNVGKVNSSKVDATRPKHQQQLAEDISSNVPLKIRLEAFKNLLNSHLPTVVSSESWPLLQKNLVDSLCEANPEIFQYSLQMHVKLLASTSDIMKDGLLCLIDGLRTHYSRKFHTYLPSYDGGLDLTNNVHKRLIKISHLLLETAKSMTENWIRMGEKFIEEIMNAFLALLTMHTYESMCSKNMLYPFHIFAALDPRGKWCLHWIHCGFGRNIFLSMQSRVVTLLRYLTEEINSLVKSPIFANNGDIIQECLSKNKTLICSQNIKLSVFSLCVNLFCIVLPYNKTRMFFPLPCRLHNDPVPFSAVLCWLVEHLNQSYIHSNHLNFDFITDSLVRFFKSRECPLSLCPEVINSVLEPMAYILNKKRVDIYYRVPLHSILILEAICSSEKGVLYIVDCSKFKNRRNGPYQIDTPPNMERTCNHVFTILNCTDYLLNQDINNVNSLSNLLQISSKFIKHLDFSLIFVPVTLIENIIIQFLLLHEQFKPKFSHAEINYASSSSEDLFCSFSLFLANVISWPGGLHAVLQSSNIIKDFVPSLFAYRTVLWESPDFCRLLFMLTTLPEAEEILTLECKKPISEALQNLWKILEDEESFVKGIERDSRRALIRFMNIVYSFTSTLVGTKVFFSELDDSDETLLECACNPTSPIELLLLESSNDPWHKISLLTLQTLTRNFDAWIYIESKFEIENHLLRLQRENISSSLFHDTVPQEQCIEKEIIIDEFSVIRHEILSAVCIVCTSNNTLAPNIKCDILCNYIAENSPDVCGKILTTNEHCSTEPSKLNILLEDTEYPVKDKNWLINLRKTFRTLKAGDVNVKIIISLTEQVFMCDSSNKMLDWENIPSFESETLTLEENIGINITIRYGIQNDLLNKSLSNNKLFSELILQIQTIFNVHPNEYSFKGFDWFLATVFLLCTGDLGKCHIFLNHFVSLPISLVIWPMFAETKGKRSFYLAFSSLVDWVTRCDVSSANAALQSCGISWGVVCYGWIRQCFLNVLDWSQVCEWLALCILYPPDVAVYFCSALLSYIEPKILEASSSGKIWNQIVRPFASFTIFEHMVFIDKSITQHRSIVLPKLLQIISF